MRTARFARVAAISAAVVVLATGCTQVAVGNPEWDEDQASVPVPGKDINDIIVEPDQVNDLVGADLQEQLTRNTPYTDDDSEECGALKGGGIAGFAGEDWERFEYIMASDKTDDGMDNIVAQSATLYPDADTAQDAYDELTADFTACDGFTYTSSEVSWEEIVEDEPDDGIATWTLYQTDPDNGWQCDGQAEVRNNMLLRVMVCQFGTGGADTAAELVRMMANSVWDRSAPS